MASSTMNQSEEHAPESPKSQFLSGLKVDENEIDSAVAEIGTFASTAWGRSGVYDYVEENGRRYHKFKEGKYLLPNDESEQKRLDIQHHLMLLLLDGKLHVAPIENMKGGLRNVLDIATGNGNWAIDFARTYPSANVVGTDLSPIQPTTLPANCSFEINDAEDAWLFPQQFDYIHGRTLVTCFQSHRVVFTHAFSALRPGGYFELQDCDLPMRFLDASGAGSALGGWSERFMAGAAALGRDFTNATKYRRMLEEIGFVDVVERTAAFPIGTWAAGEKDKLLGRWMRENFVAGLDGISKAIMTRGLGMTAQEVDEDLVKVKEEILSNKVHAYFLVVLLYARKPQ